MTFNDIFLELMELKEFEYSSHTLADKKAIYNKHLKPLIGDFDISVLTYPILQGSLNSLLKNGYAPKSVAHVRDIIRTVFAHANRLEYISKDSSKYLTVKKIDNRRFLLLSTAEVKAFILAVKTEPDLYARCLFMFLLHGRRLNEARQLRWDWINKETKSVLIPALHSKDSFSHVYALTDDFLENLAFLPRFSDLVFPSRKTGAEFVDVRKAFWKILERANIPRKKMRIHYIRHLVGTVAIASGNSLEQVKYALGHNSISTTMRYVTVDAEKSRAVTSLIMSFNLEKSK